MAAGQALTGVMGYSIAKAGIENFTRWLSVDLARRYGHGIRVNALAPGFVVANQNRARLTPGRHRRGDSCGWRKRGVAHRG